MSFGLQDSCESQNQTPAWAPNHKRVHRAWVRILGPFSSLLFHALVIAALLIFMKFKPGEEEVAISAEIANISDLELETPPPLGPAPEPESAIEPDALSMNPWDEATMDTTPLDVALATTDAWPQQSPIQLDAGILNDDATRRLNDALRPSSEVRFFNIKTRTRSVILLLDASQTVINKGVLEDVIRETGVLIEGLSPMSMFNIIGFVDGAAPMFPRMMLATPDNKQAALARMNVRAARAGEAASDWTESGFVPNRVGNLAGYSGSTPWKALELAASMGAETVFIVIDDEPPYVIHGAPGDAPIATHLEDLLQFARGIGPRSERPMQINVVMTAPRDNSRAETAKSFYDRLCKYTGGALTFMKPPAPATAQR